MREGEVWAGFGAGNLVSLLLCRPCRGGGRGGWGGLGQLGWARCIVVAAAAHVQACSRVLYYFLAALFVCLFVGSRLLALCWFCWLVPSE